MKCKVFLATWSQTAEKEINEWLEEKGPIQINHVQAFGLDNYGYIYIFYSTRKDKLERLEELNT